MTYRSIFYVTLFRFVKSRVKECHRFPDTPGLRFVVDFALFVGVLGAVVTEDLRRALVHDLQGPVMTYTMLEVPASTIALVPSRQ